MNAAQIHLALNHVPVMLLPVGLVLFILGLRIHSRTGTRILAQAGGYVLVVAGLCILPVYFSGEGSEEVVEDIAGVSERQIEAHEDAALPAAVMGGLAALGAAAFLFASRGGRTPGKIFVPVVVGCTAISVVLMVRAAHLGGLIRHSELGSPSTHASGDSD